MDSLKLSISSSAEERRFSLEVGTLVLGVYVLDSGPSSSRAGFVDKVNVISGVRSLLDLIDEVRTFGISICGSSFSVEGEELLSLHSAIGLEVGEISTVVLGAELLARSFD